MTRPSDSKIISLGVELLRGGTLASNLPGELMEEFSISAAQARELAGKAIERHEKEKGKASPTAHG